MYRIPPEFSVIIPEDRIAQHPLPRRDQSRLLVYDKSQSKITHISIFTDIVNYLDNSLIVINDTWTAPVRIIGRKPTGGFLELLFVSSETNATTSHAVALINPASKIKPGMILALGDGIHFTVEKRSSNGGWQGIWHNDISNETLDQFLKRVGMPPLPPYIKRKPEEIDRTRYQTVFARSGRSLAAPTAGLHFTDDLMKQIKYRGNEITPITLNIGLGTFTPIKSQDLSQHVMHREDFVISDNSAVKIEEAKTNRKPVMAVGTTVVRALEFAARQGRPLIGMQNAADLFIYPPYQFQIVDQLITNFHRPDSTLLLLVAALIGWEAINECYTTALNENFRFFSYGDAMMII